MFASSLTPSGATRSAQQQQQTPRPAYVGRVPAEVFETVNELRGEAIAKAGAAKMEHSGRYSYARVPYRDYCFTVFGGSEPYTVDLAGMTCTCGAFCQYGYCKHLEWLPDRIERDTPRALPADADLDDDGPFGPDPGCTVALTIAAVGHLPVIGGHLHHAPEARDGYADSLSHPSDIIEAYID